MNVSKKDWFCHRCSLPSDCKYNHSLHLHKNTMRSNNSDLKSNKPISSEEKPDSNNRITSDQNKKKSFKCESHQHYSSQRDNLSVASVQERKMPFKCELCNYS